MAYCDWGLHDGDLVEHVVRLRPQILVLHTSGYTDDAIVHQRVLEPDVAFIQKPYTPQSLAAQVRERLDVPVGVCRWAVIGDCPYWLEMC